MQYNHRGLLQPETDPYIRNICRIKDRSMIGKFRNCALLIMTLLMCSRPVKILAQDATAVYSTGVNHG
ncbi:MAG: hypothetical protein AMS26_04305 [Bacteroides sp. SM23_62]|nr:MAG: hypothetical protein AMS26_04305 [Bacteroides sp. SM23_62]